jgi:hypothetical protein
MVNVIFVPLFFSLGALTSWLVMCWRMDQQEADAKRLYDELTNKYIVTLDKYKADIKLWQGDYLRVLSELGRYKTNFNKSEEKENG